MKKYLFVLLTTIAFNVTIAEVHARDSTEAMASKYYERAQLYVPRGADIISITKARESSALIVMGIFIRFDYRDVCYMAYQGRSRFALTTINCPGDNK